MKVTLKPEKTFFRTTIEVWATDDKEIDHINFIEKIEKATLENTTGIVNEHFKKALIDGTNDALLLVRENAEGYYKIDIIVKVDHIAEVVGNVMDCAYVAVEENIATGMLAAIRKPVSGYHTD